MRMKCLDLCLTFFSIVGIFISCEGYNISDYQNAIASISASDSCFSKSPIIGIHTTCIPCTDSRFQRYRYHYSRSRCRRAYGWWSTLQIIRCSNNNQYCRMECNSLGAKRCCYRRFGPLCLSCPKGPVNRNRGVIGVCSGAGTCTAGVSGTGYCRCKYRFRGTACQKCRAGYYGSYCHLRCNCARGYCEGGPRRKCICPSGWSGTFCQSKISACENNNCTSNETCTTGGECKCKIGYEGENCTVSDLCAKNPCSKYATCSQTYSTIQGRQVAICKCKPGFTGDGFGCVLKDPCRTNLKKCPRNERCVTIGRQMPKCICNEKYHREKGKCVLKKCKNPQLCSKNSICYYDPSYLSEQYCRCKPGYYGKKCEASLSAVVTQILKNKKYARQTNVIRLMGKKLTISFAHKKTTILLPLSKRYVRFYSNANIVTCHHHSILSSVNERNGTFYTAFGDKLTFEFTGGNSSDSLGKIFFNNDTIEILAKNDTINGRVYLIDKEIKAVNKNFTASNTDSIDKIIERLSNATSSLYKRYLQIRTRKPPSRYVFRNTPLKVYAIPIMNLTEHEFGYLTSSNEMAKYRLNHLFESMTSKNKIRSPPLITTLYSQRRLSSTHSFFFGGVRVANNGRISIHGANVLGNGILTSKFYVIVVDRPFEDSLARPILPGQCNLKQTHLIKIPWRRPCPKGSFKIKSGGWARASTCQKDIIVKRQCCPGFFGPTCSFHCPGPYSKPCNKRGKCLDGIEGKGTCVCNEMFAGLACEKCASPRSYGEGCNKTCGCLNGLCDGGSIYATGKCIKCRPGFQGTNCDKKIVFCKNETLSCKESEVCQYNENWRPICGCKSGYTRNDTNATCIPHNPCTDPASQYGNCHEMATCTYISPGISKCTCPDGFYGDGVICEKSWKECKEAADCKTKGSVCIKGACRCESGRTFHKDECLFRFDCGTNNGGCHPAAKCNSRAVDNNSHCVCPSSLPGDGFVCIQKWMHSSYLLKYSGHRSFWYRAAKIQTTITDMTFRPITILFPAQGMLSSENLRRYSFLGLVYVPENDFAFETTDFFYPKQRQKQMQGFKITTRNSVTYLNGVKVLKANIPVEEGLLHILEKPLPRTPSVYHVNVTIPSTTPTPTPKKVGTTTTIATPPVPTKTSTMLMFPITNVNLCKNPYKVIEVETKTSKKTSERSILRYCGKPANMWSSGRYCLIGLFQLRIQQRCPKGFMTKTLVRSPWMMISSPSVKIRVGGKSGRYDIRSLTMPIFCCRADAPNKIAISNLKQFAFFPFHPRMTCERDMVLSRRDAQHFTVKSEMYLPPRFNSELLPDGFRQVHRRLEEFRLELPSIIMNLRGYYLCRVKSVEVRPSLPPPTESMRYAYLIFNNESCPAGDTQTLNIDKQILHFPVFGPHQYQARKISLCVLRDKTLLPPGRYCVSTWPPSNSSCTMPGQINSRHAVFANSPWAAHIRLCCGVFRSKRMPITERLKSMPTFTLIREERYSSYCPYLPGYTRSIARITFIEKGEKVALPPFPKTLVRRRCGVFDCLELCHYSSNAIASFTLPKPWGGCEKSFKSGFRVQFLEKNDTRMPIRSLHLAGYFKKHDNKITLEFCTSLGHPMEFPKGSYCIYRKFGVCPAGFTSGSAEIDDENDVAHSFLNVGGIVPDGVFEADSKYYFCCRNDSDVNNEITLLFSKSFYLFKSPSANQCQKVTGFRVTHEVLVLDAEDDRDVGKPPVVKNGSVPMTRSNFRGSDIDVHYCYYRKLNATETAVKLRLIKFGQFCPTGTESLKFKSLEKKMIDTCYFNSTAMYNKFPSGDYCVFSDFSKECPEGFYNVRDRYFKFNEPLPHASHFMVCCRENPKGIFGVLNLDFLGDISFGFIAPFCPPVKDKILIQQKKFYSYKTCYYVSGWPAQFSFALPMLGVSCPPGFHSTTIDSYFLGMERDLSDIFKNDTISNTSSITDLNICLSDVKAVSAKVSWPKGHYCVFSEDERVTKEFPISVRFFKGKQGQTRISTTFLFCRADGPSSKSTTMPPLRYLSIPTLTKNCSFNEYNANSNTRAPESILKILADTNIEIHNPSNGKQLSYLSEVELNFCFYGDEKFKKLSFNKNDLIDKCHCLNKFASCVAGRCTCNENFYGDGNVCLPCNCAPTATCFKSRNPYSRKCQCLLGSHGDGHVCNTNAYVQTIVIPDKDILDWPEGEFSFLKTYDNMDCPNGFKKKTSSLIGRLERFQYTMDFTTNLCAKDTQKGRGVWPKGNYCVWASKDGVCPKSLTATSYFFPYEYLNSEDDYIRRHTLKGAQTYMATFCCMTSSDPAQVLRFPPVKFFTLLRVTDKCPNVKFMIKSEEHVMLSRGLVYPPSLPSMNNSQNGPYVELDYNVRAFRLVLCNYYINRLPFYPRECNESNAKFCQPSETLVEVIKEYPSLSNLQYVLSKCKFFEKLSKLHHIQITMFIGYHAISSSTKEELSRFDCNVLKEQVILTKLPFTLMLPTVNTSGSLFVTIGNDFVTVKKLNSTDRFLVGDMHVNRHPLIYTKDGIIFDIDQTATVNYSQTKSSVAPMVAGIVITLLIVTAAVCLVSYWFFKRRPAGTSISSFMNPVYYRRMEATDRQ